MKAATIILSILLTATQAISLTEEGLMYAIAREEERECDGEEDCLAQIQGDQENDEDEEDGLS